MSYFEPDAHLEEQYELRTHVEDDLVDRWEDDGYWDDGRYDDDPSPYDGTYSED